MEATERAEQQREEFRCKVEAINRRRIVFIDETGFHLAMTRRFGRAPRGQRVGQSAPRKRGTNVTPVGALALRGWAAALSSELLGKADHNNLNFAQNSVPLLP